MTSLSDALEETRDFWKGEMDKAILRKERDTVIRALNDAGMNGTVVAAESLGITQEEIKQLIRKHGIRPKWISDPRAR